MKILIILNEPPYGNERSYNGLRLAGSLTRQSDNQVKVFLIGDAVNCAKSGQRTPQGFYNVQSMLSAVLRRAGVIGACGSCLDARGIQNQELIEGIQRSSIEERGYDLLAYVPPHRSPQAVRSAGLAQENGWIPANRNTMETAFPGVYALGDVVSIPLKMGKPLPKAGVFAHREASVVVRNIVREIKGKGKPAEFEGDGMFYRDRRWKGRFRQRQFFCRTAASSKGASAVTALACRKGPL